MKYSKTNATKCLEECKRLLEKGVLPTWDELPEIDLYMDQVIEIVNKYLSLLSGDLDNFFISYEYILKAIHILIKNEIIELKGILILTKDNMELSNFVFKENDFTKKVIEKAKTMSDKQFMREVLSNV